MYINCDFCGQEIDTDIEQRWKIKGITGWAKSDITENVCYDCFHKIKRKLHKNKK